MGDFLVETEMDLGYAPDFAVDAIVGLGYERELGPGEIAAWIKQNVGLYDALEVGDTEFPLSYEMVARGFVVAIEVEPILTADRELTTGGAVLLAGGPLVPPISRTPTPSPLLLRVPGGHLRDRARQALSQYT